MLNEIFIVRELVKIINEKDFEYDFKIIYKYLNGRNNYEIKFLLVKYYYLFEILYMFNKDQKKYTRELLTTNYNAKNLPMEVLIIRKEIINNINKVNLTFKKETIDKIFDYIKERMLSRNIKTILAMILHKKFKEKLLITLYNFTEEEILILKEKYTQAIKDNDYFYIMYNDEKKEFTKIQRAINRLFNNPKHQFLNCYKG